MKKSPSHDVIIIGAGAAGMTAALFCARKGLKTHIIGKDLGGQTATTDHINNYPGILAISGSKLMEQFYKHVTREGIALSFGEVTRLNALKKKFSIMSTAGRFTSAAVILAFGLSPRDLDIPGEQKFQSHGITNDIIIDGPKLKGKIVAVVGGGNAALEAALSMGKICPKVYLIHRRDQFRADAKTITKVMKSKRIELVLNATVSKVKGSSHIQSIQIVVEGTKKVKELTVNGIIVKIGFHSDTKFLRNIVALNNKNEIIIDKNCTTSTPGIFACGDVTDIAYKQTIISAGEGAKAALQAYKYLQQQSGKPAIMIDWK